MQTKKSVPASLSDVDLFAHLKWLATCERAAAVEVLRALIEFDERRLYLGLGYPSLFAYCTRVLHYAEHAAFNRIEVARAARDVPALFDAIEEGSLNLTGARLLAPHLTSENASSLLREARFKSKREIEEIVVRLKPKADAMTIVRRLPTPTTQGKARPSISSTRPLPIIGDPAPMPPPAEQTPTRPTVQPLAPERYKVQFTIDGATHEILRAVQALMRHAVPNGDIGEIFSRALKLLLEELHRKRFAAAAHPRAQSVESRGRHIPAAVRRTVWRRDGGRCVFAGTDGRCNERDFLEFHHVIPFAAGGTATLENIQLRCRAHNAFEASPFLQRDVVEDSP